MRRLLERSGSPGLAGLYGFVWPVLLALPALPSQEHRPSQRIQTPWPEPPPVWLGQVPEGRRRVPRRRRFFFDVRPPLWRVQHNGRLLSPWQGMPFQVQVGPGRHVFTFTHPWAYPHRAVVGPRTPAGTLRHRLRWRPATLLVDVEPGGAKAGYAFQSPPWLARQPDRTPGLLYRIRLPQRLRRLVRARLLIWAVGYRSQERRVTLTPNRLCRLQVRLRPLVALDSSAH